MTGIEYQLAEVSKDWNMTENERMSWVTETAKDYRDLIESNIAAWKVEA